MQKISMNETLEVNLLFLGFAMKPSKVCHEIIKSILLKT